MYVISRKRVSMILICLLLGIFVYSYAGTKLKTEQKVEETSSTPVSGKVIVLDAGHGVPDERSTKFKWYNGSGNKFKNYIETSEFARTKWMYSYFNTF